MKIKQKKSISLETKQMIRRLDIGEHQSQICAGLLLATSTIKTVLNAEYWKYTRN